MATEAGVKASLQLPGVGVREELLRAGAEGREKGTQSPPACARCGLCLHLPHDNLVLTGLGLIEVHAFKVCVVRGIARL